MLIKIWNLKVWFLLGCFKSNDSTAGLNAIRSLLGLCSLIICHIYCTHYNMLVSGNQLTNDMYFNCLASENEKREEGQVKKIYVQLIQLKEFYK